MTATHVELRSHTHSTPDQARVVGGVVGLVVALTLVLSAIALAWDQAHDWGIPTVVTGAIGGFLFGPRGARAATRGPLVTVRVAVELALAAVVIGSLVVAVGLFAVNGLAEGDLGTVLMAMFYGPIIAVVGIVYIGIFVLPFTLLAGAIWAAAMRLAYRTP